MRVPFFLMLSCALFLAVGAAGAADGLPAGPRSWAPVQDGFVADAPAVPQWLPDRVLIQLTPESYQIASLPRPNDKAMGPLRTGIASLDEALDASRVTGARIAFPAVKNAALAASLGTNRWLVLDLARGSDVPAVARALAADPAVAEALPDLVAFPSVAPNDTYYGMNWGHNNTAQLNDLDWGGTYGHTLPGTVGTPGFDANAEAAWNGAQGYGDPAVVIAILDTGVDPGHPDLVQTTGYDFGDLDNNPADDSAAAGHGTACAGVAAGIADNIIGVAGVAGGCTIMPLKVANSAGSLGFSAITNAIYYAADNGADILSMSFGAATTAYAPTDAAVAYAFSLGCTMLAATGNNNNAQIEYPAYNPNVIGVGAASPCGERKRSSSSSGEVNPGVSTDPNGYTCDGERWWGSSYGSTVADHQGAVDVIAPTILPTTDIQGAAGYDPGSYSGWFNGTSCATPYAAGVCALIKSANPGFSPTQIRNQLVNTAQDVVSVESVVGWDRYAGYGMVDAAAAVGAVVNPGAVAAFSASDTTGCAPLLVTFTDESVGTINTWTWTFGDGGVSGNQNPTHTYTAAGTYNVTLAVTSDDGDDILTKTGYIVVGETPGVAFSKSTQFVPAGTPVAFTDESTGDPDTWLWVFGDGNTSTAQNPSHAFSVPGVYYVKLIATNACGPDSLVDPNFLVVTAPPGPVADFGFDPSGGCAPVTVAFTDASTGAPTGWLWSFGDGATSTLQNPSHEYTVPGTYDVSLVATNAGGTDTLTVAGAVTVGGGPVVAAFAWSDTLVAYPADITFTDQSTGGVTSWLWSFGDGAVDSVASPVHTYTASGDFDVTLIVSNGCTADTLTVAAAIQVNGASGVGDRVAARFGLGANYPNPFNPSTTLVYSLERPGHARLEIYDVSGRRLATLVDADRAAGRHEVVWRPEDLPSGVYFSRLTVAGRTDTRRVTLLK
ncbi:PKD domain-containing protein [bacterium]|nr:PKD domain-containing protein [bacterium]